MIGVTSEYVMVNSADVTWTAEALRPQAGGTVEIVIRFLRPDARQHGLGAFSDSAGRFVFGRVATELDAAATRAGLRLSEAHEAPLGSA